jgi:hypothetical protein
MNHIIIIIIIIIDHSIGPLLSSVLLVSKLIDKSLFPIFVSFFPILIF